MDGTSNPRRGQAEEIMTPPVITIGLHATVQEALELMAQHGFRQLLVVEKDKPGGGLIAQRFTIQEEVDFLTSKAYRPAKDASGSTPSTRVRWK